MTELNVTPNGVISEGAKVKGVEYLSDAKRDAFLRENEIAAVYGGDGSILCPSAHAPTDDERELIGEQEIRFGPHAGKKLAEVPELFAPYAKAEKG